jgi:hypothetical protein
VIKCSCQQFDEPDNLSRARQVGLKATWTCCFQNHARVGHMGLATLQLLEQVPMPGPADSFRHPAVCQFYGALMAYGACAKYLQVSCYAYVGPLRV